MAMASSFDGPVALVTDMPICAVHREPGGDRIGPSSQPNGSLKNDSGKANGGGGIGVAAPAQSIAYPPLSPWPWVPRVRFTHAALQLARALQDCRAPLRSRLTSGAAPVF